MNQERHQVLASVSLCHFYSPPVGKRDLEGAGMLSNAKRVMLRWLRALKPFVQALAVQGASDC